MHVCHYASRFLFLSRCIPSAIRILLFCFYQVTPLTLTLLHHRSLIPDPTSIQNQTFCHLQRTYLFVWSVNPIFLSDVFFSHCSGSYFCFFSGTAFRSDFGSDSDCICFVVYVFQLIWKGSRRLMWYSTWSSVNLSAAYGWSGNTWRSHVSFVLFFKWCLKLMMQNFVITLKELNLPQCVCHMPWPTSVHAATSKHVICTTIHINRQVHK